MRLGFVGRSRIARGQAGIAGRTSLGKALRGHNRYTVAFTPGTHPRERLLVLGAISALDLIRVKRRNK